MISHELIEEALRYASQGIVATTTLPNVLRSAEDLWTKAVSICRPSIKDILLKHTSSVKEEWRSHI